jgi:hypothetical protein
LAHKTQLSIVCPDANTYGGAELKNAEYSDSSIGVENVFSRGPARNGIEKNHKIAFRVTNAFSHRVLHNSDDGDYSCLA